MSFDDYTVKDLADAGFSTLSEIDVAMAAVLNRLTNAGSAISFVSGKALQTNAITGYFETSNVSNTELSYLVGVTSSIQTQIAARGVLVGNNNWTGVNKFGDGGTTDYIEISATGHVHKYGAATTWRDEYGRISGSKLESPASDILWVNAEAAYQFKNSITYGTDYVVITIQLNHDRKLTAEICPHVHWEQTQATYNIATDRPHPNFIVQYRYQKQGGAKETSWTDLFVDPLDSDAGNAFSYTSGTLNQITNFPHITPPSGDGVSDIVQIRLTRDYLNTGAGLYGDAETGTVDFYVTDFDFHIECDDEGSNTEYSKSY